MNWEDYLMGFAQHAALKSKDSTQVGAALVDQNRTIRATGFNGPPMGVLDLPERRERPTKYLFASHAEANLIAFSARNCVPTEGCTVFVTHMCCSACMRTLIQAGIRQIFYGPGTTSMPAEEFAAAYLMAQEAGVSLVAWKPDA